MRSNAPRKTILRGLALAALTIVAFVALSCASGPRPGASGRKPGRPVPGADVLSGPAWLLAGYRPADQFIPLEPEHGSTAYLSFGKDGNLSGFTGTNQIAGSWKLAGSGDRRPITIDARLARRDRAENAIAARFEADFLRLLSASRTCRREPGAIQFLDARGTPILRFIRRD